jgi:hypothetical protein
MIRTSRSHRRGAFTLVELLIAITLGMAIIFTALSGFRMASQSVTVANHLALENSLMRAGYFMAVDEADFWQSYDDPDDATATREGQKLRQFANYTPWHRGLPFAPFDGTSFPRSGAAGSEQERGWDPDYAWPASDPRAWFHGNLVEEIASTQSVFGRYGIFCHHKDHPDLRALASNGTTFGVDYGVAAPAHTWYCNQLESLKNVLGYYGVCEYMPANAIYGVLGDPGGDNTWGTGDDNDSRLEWEWCQPAGSGGGVQWRFANDDGGTEWPRGIYRHTRDSTYALVPASRYTATRTDQLQAEPLISQGFRSWATDRVGAAADTSAGNHGLSDLLGKALITTPVLPSRPAAWPDLKVAVMRYVNNCRFVTLCKVRWVSPVTSQTVEMSFTTLATSLRGARQQRAPGGGWADPGQPNLDHP